MARRPRTLASGSPRRSPTSTVYVRAPHRDARPPERGRIGWNIVTGYLDSAARNLGLARLARTTTATTRPTNTSRSSTSSGSTAGTTTRSAATGRTASTPTRQGPPIGHRGRYYEVPGFHLSEPSPQRTPFLYQAGTSSRGTASRRATPSAIRQRPSKPLSSLVGRLREAVAAAGRDPGDACGLCPGAGHYRPDDARGPRQAERIRAPRRRRGLADPAVRLDRRGFLPLPLDATIEYIDTDAGRTALASFSSADPDRRWTVGEAARFIGLGGRGPYHRRPRPGRRRARALGRQDRHRRLQPRLCGGARDDPRRGRPRRARTPATWPLSDHSHVLPICPSRDSEAAGHLPR